MKSEFILPKMVTSFMSTFKKNNFQIYLVGGAVRDIFLKKEIYDWDFTTSATPEEILKLFPNGIYENNFGTVLIPQDNKIIFEITPMRKETEYDDFRHPKKIEWTKNIEEDLSRRDFTINAIAYDGEKTIDPFFGTKDLENKIIKAVGYPDKRFNEDALRLIRAVRIATELQFVIEDKTKESIIKNSQLIENISRERIRDELFKIIKSKHPSEGILFLKNTGLLKYILPIVDQAFSIPQKSPKRHHIYDVGTHMVMSLKNCKSDDIIVRLASLLHDIGKVKTFKKDVKTKLITFFNHEIIGGKLILKIAEDLKLSSIQKDKLYKLVRFHQFTVTEIQTDKAVKRFIKNIGKENIEDMLIVREADRIGSGATPTSWRTELFKKRIIEVQQEPFKITDLKINGNEIMKLLKIPPSRKVGEILNQIFQLVEEKKLENKKKDILDYLKKNNLKN